MLLLYSCNHVDAACLKHLAPELGLCALLTMCNRHAAGKRNALIAAMTGLTAATSASLWVALQGTGIAWLVGFSMSVMVFSCVIISSKPFSGHRLRPCQSRLELCGCWQLPQWHWQCGQSTLVLPPFTEAGSWLTSSGLSLIPP